MAQSGDSGEAPGALVWCPFPDEETALATIHRLLDEKLIACGNVIPGMTSVFEWQGERETAREVGVLLKTHPALLDRAAARVGELHPYEVPAVLGWRCGAAPDGARQWLSGFSRPNRSS